MKENYEKYLGFKIVLDDIEFVAAPQQTQKLEIRSMLIDEYQNRH